MLREMVPPIADKKKPMLIGSKKIDTIKRKIVAKQAVPSEAKIVQPARLSPQ